MSETASYYLYHEGNKYDRALLECADKCVESTRDGRVSEEDAELLLTKVTDRNIVTDIEIRTLNHIKKNYNLTLPALNLLNAFLAKHPDA